jgi:hypothetical protein
MRLFKQGLQDRLLSHLPDRFKEWGTHTALYMLTAMGLRRVPVVLMRGPTPPEGRPGSLLAAGQEPWIRYLPNRFFGSEPARELLVTTSIRELPKLLNRFGKNVDLSLVRVNRWSGRGLFRHSHLTVPEWVGMKLAVPKDLEQLIRSGSSIKRDMTLVRRHRYQTVDMGSAAEFDMFYHSFYVPFLRARYGELAFIRDYHDLRRRLSAGGILWVQREGKRVAAALFELKSRTLDLSVLGTLNGDYSLVKRGALAALYFYIIKFAQDLGCNAVDMKGSRPSLLDGLLRYKNKWGASLYDMKSSYYDLLVGWNNPNQIVREFFTHTPLIFRENGRLSAIVGSKPQKSFPLWINGLHRMHLITESGCRPLNLEWSEQERKYLG